MDPAWSSYCSKDLIAKLAEADGRLMQMVNYPFVKQQACVACAIDQKSKNGA